MPLVMLVSQRETLLGEYTINYYDANAKVRANDRINVILFLFIRQPNTLNPLKTP